MENANKAIIMAGHVLIFIFALSVGIFMYQTLIYTQDQILIASENFSQEAEHLSTIEDYTRVVKGSEIFGTVMSSVESTDMSAVIRKDDYTPDYIIIDNSKEINLKKYKDQFKNGNGNGVSQAGLFNIIYGLNFNSDYRLSYKFNNDNNETTVTAIYSKIDN